MAADGDACCENDPNFAVICGFLEKFGVTCGLANIDFLDLQEMLENTLEVPQELVDLHIKLLRKARKSVSSERWERAIIKFCHSFNSQDAWEIERFGYKKARLSSKLRILKELLEIQFDYNSKFKNDVNKLSAEELRTQPLGKDRTGHVYWYQSDETCQIRVYKEDPDEETWSLVVKNREDLVKLITELSDGKETVINEDSNSLESEKPIIDTGQTDSNSNSDSNKTDLPSVEAKAETNGEDEDDVVEEGENAQDAKSISKVKLNSKEKSPSMEESVVNASQAVKLQEVASRVEGEEKIVEKKLEQLITSSKPVEAESQAKIVGETHPIMVDKKLPEITTGVKEKYIRSDSLYSHHRKAVESAGFDVTDTSDLKRPLSEIEDIEVPSYIKRPRLDRPTLLGNKKKVSYSEEEDEEDDDEISDEIEEPLMLVKGDGLGQDNKTSNPAQDAYSEIIVEDEIEEPVMHFFGFGNGHDCETGNDEKQTEQTASNSSLDSKQNESPNTTDETVNDTNSLVSNISPKKGDFKLGTIFDTKTGERSPSQPFCTNKKSRWDIGKPADVPSDNNVECETPEGASKSVNSAPKRSMFFFGPGCLTVKPSLVTPQLKTEMESSVEQFKDATSATANISEQNLKDVDVVCEEQDDSVLQECDKTKTDDVCVKDEECVSVKCVVKTEIDKLSKENLFENNEHGERETGQLTINNDNPKVLEAQQELPKIATTEMEEIKCDEIAKTDSLSLVNSSNIENAESETGNEESSKDMLLSDCTDKREISIDKKQTDIPEEINEDLNFETSKVSDVENKNSSPANSNYPLLTEPIKNTDEFENSAVAIKEFKKCVETVLTENSLESSNIEIKDNFSNSIDICKKAKSEDALEDLDTRQSSSKDLQTEIVETSKYVESPARILKVVKQKSPETFHVPEVLETVDEKPPETVETLQESIQTPIENEKIDVPQETKIEKLETCEENISDFLENSLTSGTSSSVPLEENEEKSGTSSSVPLEESEDKSSAQTLEILEEKDNSKTSDSPIENISEILKVTDTSEETLRDTSDDTLEAAKQVTSQTSESLAPIIPVTSETTEERITDISEVPIERKPKILEEVTKNNSEILEVPEILETIEVKNIETLEVPIENTTKSPEAANESNPETLEISNESSSKILEVTVERNDETLKLPSESTSKISKITTNESSVILEPPSENTFKCSEVITESGIEILEPPVENTSTILKTASNTNSEILEAFVENKSQILEATIENNLQTLKVPVKSTANILQEKTNNSKSGNSAETLELNTENGSKSSEIPADVASDVLENSSHNLEISSEITSEILEASSKSSSKTLEVSVQQTSKILETTEKDKLSASLNKEETSEVVEELVHKSPKDLKVVNENSSKILEHNSKKIDKKKFDHLKTNTRRSSTKISKAKMLATVKKSIIGGVEKTNEVESSQHLKSVEVMQISSEILDTAQVDESNTLEEIKEVGNITKKIKSEEVETAKTSDEVTKIDSCSKLEKSKDVGTSEVLRGFKLVDISKILEANLEEDSGDSFKESKSLEEEKKKAPVPKTGKLTKEVSICKTRRQTKATGTVKEKFKEIESSKDDASETIQTRKRVKKSDSSEVVKDTDASALNDPLSSIENVNCKSVVKDMHLVKSNAVVLIEKLDTSKVEIKQSKSGSKSNVPLIEVNDTQSESKNDEVEDVSATKNQVSIRRSSRQTKKTAKFGNKNTPSRDVTAAKVNSGVQKISEPVPKKKMANIKEIETQIISNEEKVPKKIKSPIPTGRITRKKSKSLEEKKEPSNSEDLVEANEPICVEKKIPLLIIDEDDSSKKEKEKSVVDEEKRKDDESISKEIFKSSVKDDTSTKIDDNNENVQEIEDTPPSLTLANFQLDVDDSVIAPVTLRVTRKRAAQQSVDALREKTKQLNSETKGGSSEGSANKRPKLKQKRTADRKLRKSIEEQKAKQISSSEDDNIKETIEPEKKVQSDGENDNKAEPEIAEVAKVVTKRRASVRSETSKSDTSVTHTEKKQRKNKRMIMGLEILPEAAALIQNDTTPIRQSRRIAQLKIREEAERRKLEEDALTEMKEELKRKSKKSIDKDYKERKKSSKPVSEDETTNDAPESEEKKKRKRKRKHWNPNTHFDIYKAWKSSSGSSSSEVEDEEEEIEEDDDQPLVFKSDHEFSPESDLEEGAEVQPLKRARTVRKEFDAEEEEIDDCACQKCSQKDHPEWILLCDSCDAGWHCSCLRPALLVIPEGDWFCPPCQHNTLVKKLENHLLEFDKRMNKREMELRRKERLAYVGISLDNVLPSKDGDETRQRIRYQEDKGDEQDDEEDNDRDADVSHKGSDVSDDSDSDEESESEESSASQSDSDEPVYQLRERRQAHSYRFNDYDELINSAIQEELDAVKGAGNCGRGKDIATIVNAEKEEMEINKNLSVKDEKLEADGGEELEPLPPVVATYDDKTIEESDEEIRRPARKIITKKKHRKLNSLDVSSEDDADSDEDFKGSSSSESEEDNEFSGSESSDEYDTRRGKRRKDFGPVRRSTRARISRYDKDFINDESDSGDDAPKRKKTKSLWNDSESEESDRSWGNRGRRKAKKSGSRKKKTYSDKPKKVKKKKRRTGDDSDPDVYRKRPNIKFGGLNEEEEVGRRTRGKKINYLEALGTDSEDDIRRKPPRIEESEDEYIVHEDEDFKHQLENEHDSDESGVDTVIQDIAKLPPQKPKRGRGKAGLKIPRKSKGPLEPDLFASTPDDLFSCTDPTMTDPSVYGEPPKTIYEQQPTEMYSQTVPQTADMYSTVIPSQVQFSTSHQDMYTTAYPDVSHGAITPNVYPVSSMIMNQSSATLMDQPLNYTSHDSQDLEDESDTIEQINKNVEQMNEQEMEKMMEEEDYATKQLQLVGLQLEKEKRRKEREAQRLEHAMQIDQKLPKKRGRKPKNSLGEVNYNNSPSMMISNNAELSEPPGISLPMFTEMGSSLNVDGTPKKRRGRGKGKKTLAAEAAAAAAAGVNKDGSEMEGGFESSSNSAAVSPAPDSPMHGSKLGIAAPPQPFSQSQPTPSVITRMLQSSPGGSFPSQYFAGPPGNSGPRGQIPSNYQQSHYVVRGSPVPSHGMHGTAPPTNLPPMYHRSMDPSPSGGGAITVSVPNRDQNSPSVGSPSSGSPLSKGDPTPPPPPYTRAPQQVGHFPTVTASNAPTLPSRPHMSMIQPHLQQQQQQHRGPNQPPPGNAMPSASSSPYHSGMPPGYHYGSYPHASHQSLPQGEDGDSTPPIYTGAPPYTEQYLGDGGIAVQVAENSKGFEDDTGGEFVGLVSYFSSQREDDLDT